jgi:EAL and modified HD-GYP domain-containing signal transduction protein
MSQPVYFTREPVVNKGRAITANRLIAHGPTVGAIVETLQGLGESWPTKHTVFLCLGKLVPTTDLLEWEAPSNAMIEIPAPALQHPQTQALLPELAERGTSVCLSWHTPSTALPAARRLRLRRRPRPQFPRPRRSRPGPHPGARRNRAAQRH